MYYETCQVITSNDTDNKRDHLKRLQKVLSTEQKSQALMYVKNLYLQKKLQFTFTDINMLQINDLNKNLTGYVTMLGFETQDSYLYPVNHYQVSALSRYGKIENNRERDYLNIPEKNNRLSIANFLKVISYGLKLAKFTGIDTIKLEKGILGLRVLNAALTNQPKESHTLENLALGVEIIALVGEELASTQAEKFSISLSSFTFSLAVDYLTWRDNSETITKVVDGEGIRQNYHKVPHHQ